MKRKSGVWATLLILTLSPCAATYAEDGADFPLIEVKRYNPSQSSSLVRGTKQTLTGLLNSIGGKLIRDEIESTLREELENSTEIKEYLKSSQERSDLMQSLMSGIDSRMKGGVSNSNSVATIKFIGREIFGAIAGKALQAGGVSDDRIRTQLVEKLMYPFDRCTQAARTVFEANSCMDAAKAGLPANVGLIIVHQLTRQELLPNVPEALGPSARTRLESDLDQKYRVCLNQKGSSTRECVLRSMRAGTISVSEAQLNNTLGKLFKTAEVTRIKSDAEVWPRYVGCINGSADSAKMRGCIDDLTVRAGSVAAQVKIESEKALTAAYPTAADRATLAASFRTLFRKCGEEQIARNARVKGSSSLDMARCQDLVENRVIGAVARQAFTRSAKEYLKSGDTETDNVLRRTLSGFDGCWNDTLKEEGRQACLRHSVINSAETIGGHALDVRLADAVFKNSPEIKSGLLSHLKSCLQQELPSDVIHSADRDRKIEGCTGRMRREAAISGAKAMLEKSFQAHLSESEMAKLLQNRLNGQFAACLGEAPNGERLDICSVALTRESSKDAGRLILPREIRKLLDKSGQSAGAAIEPFLASLTSDLEGCLNREISEKQPNKAAIMAESCYRKSIRGVVSFVGKLQFDTQTADFYSGRPERKAELRNGLISKLESCADQGTKAAMPLGGFVSFMKECGDQSASALTVEIANDEVALAMERYLVDGPQGSFQAERSRVRDGILVDFRRCMGGSGSERGSCVDKLQRQLFEVIGLAAGGAQIKAQLGAKKPKEIVDAEQAYSACIARTPSGDELSRSLKECTKNYTLRTANTVGDLKIRSALKSALGADGYSESQTAVEAALGEYRGCLKRAEAMVMGEELMSQVGQCGVKLQNNARSIVQTRLKKLMGNPVAGADPAQSARALLARTLPCLDGLMPATPSESAEQSGVDADGILDAMVNYLRDYIDYDAEKANKDVTTILSELQRDLGAAGPEEARRKLVQLLIDRGALDQVIKSVVRTHVSQTFAAMSKEEKLGRDVEAQLLARGTYDHVFSTPEGAAIRTQIAEGVIKPVLLEGKAMKDPQVLAAATRARRDIGALLTESNDFGTVLITASVQRKMDSLGAGTRLAARLLYGKESLDWNQVRNTEKGKSAEQYIRQSILKPKLTGEDLTPEENDRRLKFAKTQVTEAATARR